MTSNFTFGFNRMSFNAVPRSNAPVPRFAVPAPVSRVPVPRAAVPIPVSRVPVSRAAVPIPRAAAAVPVTRSNRFSVTRLINFKSSGGCRSCN